MTPPAFYDFGEILEYPKRVLRFLVPLVFYFTLFFEIDEKHELVRATLALWPQIDVGEFWGPASRGQKCTNEGRRIFRVEKPISAYKSDETRFQANHANRVFSLLYEFIGVRARDQKYLQIFPKSFFPSFWSTVAPPVTLVFLCIFYFCLPTVEGKYVGFTGITYVFLVGSESLEDRFSSHS